MALTVTMDTTTTTITADDDVDVAVQATAADLAAQQARLKALQAQVAQHSDALAAAKAQLALDAATAAAALEGYAIAVRRSHEARATEAEQRERLLQAQLELASQREALGAWARRAYRQGGDSLSQSPAIVAILSDQAGGDLEMTIEVLRRVGRVRSRSVEAFTAAQQEQQDAATAAASAAMEAEQSAAAAADAKRRASQAVAAQKATVAQQAAVLSASQSQASDAQDAVAKAAEAYAAAQAAKQAADALSAGTSWPSASSEHDGHLVGPVGDCPGRDVSGYPNGRLPVDALCPLWGAPGHHLRADAAHAFNQMSQRYNSVFGRPLCITDSYRTYEAQVALKARKPHLAAVPGTSNHGWGTAIDTCGGVERFGTPQHNWLAENGPLFGWFHPSWAQAGGSKPEPWHFEYGG